MRTIGLSPKLVAAAITGAVVYAVTKLGLPWDPQLEQAINVLAAVVAAYLAPPGSVEQPAVESSDVKLFNEHPVTLPE